MFKTYKEIHFKDHTWFTILRTIDKRLAYAFKSHLNLKVLQHTYKKDATFNLIFNHKRFAKCSCQTGHDILMFLCPSTINHTLYKNVWKNPDVFQKKRSRFFLICSGIIFAYIFITQRTYLVKNYLVNPSRANSAKGVCLLKNTIFILFF